MRMFTSTIFGVMLQIGVQSFRQYGARVQGMDTREIPGGGNVQWAWQQILNSFDLVVKTPMEAIEGIRVMISFI
ncbi:hypothetical protein SEVIR_7G217900v4 [Setaria viridis]